MDASESESSEPEVGSDGLSSKPDPISTQKLGRVPKRPKAKNDVIDMEAFEKDIRSLMDSRTNAPPLDFRGYGVTKRTGGSWFLLYKNNTCSFKCEGKG